MSYDSDRAKLAQHFEHAQQARSPRVFTRRNSAWMAHTGAAWWLGYALHEPRDFAYAMPRRIACHVFGRHNPTCVGRPAPHPRRW
ncbi:hypothetical protein [Streptomyces sp. NBC_00842]|uniref:hypothetical protein n=1 Tax=Streptomyces sp. NBC_00842 TaxID=2975848 RepID=UPI00386D073C|nr:hypothetical protein OH821_17100 [Streptomyces sp. NBC_00842]